MSERERERFRDERSRNYSRYFEEMWAREGILENTGAMIHLNDR